MLYFLIAGIWYEILYAISRLAIVSNVSALKLEYSYDSVLQELAYNHYIS